MVTASVNISLHNFIWIYIKQATREGSKYYLIAQETLSIVHKSLNLQPYNQSRCMDNHREVAS